jgi:hypothetical protein
MRARFRYNRGGVNIVLRDLPRHAIAMAGQVIPGRRAFLKRPRDNSSEIVSGQNRKT